MTQKKRGGEPKRNKFWDYKGNIYHFIVNGSIYFIIYRSIINKKFVLNNLTNTNVVGQFKKLSDAKKVAELLING